MEPWIRLDIQPKMLDTDPDSIRSVGPDPYSESEGKIDPQKSKKNFMFFEVLDVLF